MLVSGARGVACCRWVAVERVGGLSKVGLPQQHWSAKLLRAVKWLLLGWQHPWLQAAVLWQLPAY